MNNNAKSWINRNIINRDLLESVGARVTFIQIIGFLLILFGIVCLIMGVLKICPVNLDDGNQIAALFFIVMLGDKKMPGIAAEDIGKCAYGVFKAGNKYKDRTIGIAGEHLTGSQMAEELSDSLHLGVNYFPVPFETYRGLDFPGADDLGNMFQFKHDFESDFCGARDVELSRELNPSLKTFHEWLEENGGKIPLE